MTASPTPTYQLDANVLVRFLRDDHRDHSPRARRLVQRANDGKVVLEVSAVTVSETFYALKAAYGVPRRQAAQAIGALLNTPAFRLPERERVLDALVRVQSANVDFGDAHLAAISVETGQAIASFDRDFDRFADVTRHEP